MDGGRRFQCYTCGGDTGAVTLSRPGAPLPIPAGIKGVPHGTENIGRRLGYASIVLEEFGSSMLIGCTSEQLDEYARVIETGAASDLYALDREACPYWCVQCTQCYCRRHWYMDGRTTSSNFYAHCPAGHVRKLFGD